MTYIDSIVELENLINNREYIDNLIINMNHDVNYLLCNLTNLTYLKFGDYYNQLTDLSILTNLQHLKFGFYYNQSPKRKIKYNLTC